MEIVVVYVRAGGGLYRVDYTHVCRDTHTKSVEMREKI